MQADLLISSIAHTLTPNVVFRVPVILIARLLAIIFASAGRSLIVLVRRRTSEVQVLKLNRTWPVKPPGLAKALNLPGIYEVVRGARGHQRRYRHSPGKIFWRARAVLAQSSERLRARNCRKQRNRQEHSTAQSGL